NQKTSRRVSLLIFLRADLCARNAFDRPAGNKRIIGKKNARCSSQKTSKGTLLLSGGHRRLSAGPSCSLKKWSPRKPGYRHSVTAYQGASVARNSPQPGGLRTNRLQTGRTEGSTHAVIDIATTGKSRACRPFERVPSAINTHAAKSHRSRRTISEGLSCRAPIRAQNASATKLAIKGSGITKWQKKKVPANAARLTAAATPAEDVPTTRRATRPVAA